LRRDDIVDSGCGSKDWLASTLIRSWSRRAAAESGADVALQRRI
jgi:hypothetical protein